MVTPPLAKFAPLANQILLHLSPTFLIKIDLGESSLFSDFLSRFKGETDRIFNSWGKSLTGKRQAGNFMNEWSFSR
jgi:hypothetical protein